MSSDGPITESKCFPLFEGSARTPVAMVARDAMVDPSSLEVRTGNDGSTAALNDQSASNPEQRSRPRQSRPCLRWVDPLSPGEVRQRFKGINEDDNGDNQEVIKDVGGVMRPDQSGEKASGSDGAVNGIAAVKKSTRKRASSKYQEIMSREQDDDSPIMDLETPIAVPIKVAQSTGVTTKTPAKGSRSRGSSHNRRSSSGGKTKSGAAKSPSKASPAAQSAKKQRQCSAQSSDALESEQELEQQPRPQQTEPWTFPSAQASNGENSPSEAMMLWCRNVDKLTPAGNIHVSCATGNTLKNQVMADLLCLYFSLFRTDISESLAVHLTLLPSIAQASGANLCRPPPPCNHPAAQKLRSAVSVLRYTKHFIKDYKGELPPTDRPIKPIKSHSKGSKKKPAAVSTEVRVMATVLMGVSKDLFAGVEALEVMEKDGNGEFMSMGDHSLSAVKPKQKARAFRDSYSNGMSERVTRISARRQKQESPLLDVKSEQATPADRTEPCSEQLQCVLASDPEKSCEPAHMQCSDSDQPKEMKNSHGKSGPLPHAYNSHIKSQNVGDEAHVLESSSGMKGMLEQDCVVNGTNSNDQVKAEDSEMVNAAAKEAAQACDAVPGSIEDTGTVLQSGKPQLGGAMSPTSGAQGSSAADANPIDSGQGTANAPAELGTTTATAIPSSQCSYKDELHAAMYDITQLPTHLRPPPAEMIIFQQASTVGELRRNIATAFKDSYQIFAKFRVDWIHCPALENNSAGDVTDEKTGVKSPPYFLQGNMPPDKDKIDQHLPVSPDGLVHLFVAGPGIDLKNSKLRHAGGEADWVVACHCGVTDDDGERMLCCDVCSRWVHSHCEGIGDSQPDPPKFTCSQCQRKPARARHSS